MPERIQLRRTAGWRKPAGTIVVARPSRWGNPYIVIGAGTEPGLLGGRERVFTVAGPTKFFQGTYTKDEATRYAVHLYRNWITGSMARCENMVPLLGGHDLACWCPLDQPCHADVLLDLANQRIDA